MDAVAGTTLATVPAFGDLRYQLFSGVAGTLAAAEPDNVAVFGQQILGRQVVEGGY